MNATTHTLESFTKEANLFLLRLRPHDDAATVVALHGDLGAGKTTFTQIVASSLGVTEPVVSPTFLLQKRYFLEGQQYAHLIHIDAYRLSSAEQLEVLDWHELLCDPSNLIFIEWPEHVADVLPDTTHHIYFTYVDEDVRSISYAAV